MTFDLDRWKERLRGHLDGWWPRAKRAGVGSVYAGLSAAALWPALEAAQKGEMTSVLLALGAISGRVGVNLIAEQIQRWKDRAGATGEADVATWVEEHAGRDAAVREALDDILERLEAITAAQAGLGESERRAFLDALRADLERLGNLPRFQATFQGSGTIAQGERAVAAGARGVAVGGDVRGSVIITGDASRVGPGTRPKDDTAREIRENAGPGAIS